MQDWKTYLQPAATVLVALSIGAIAVDQYRTSSARFTCAEIAGNSQGQEKDLARLGLPKDGDYSNVSRYCRAFMNPANSGGGYASVDIPSTIDVRITDMPSVNVYGDMGIDRIGGSVTIDGAVTTF